VDFIVNTFGFRFSVHTSRKPARRVAEIPYPTQLQRIRARFEKNACRGKQRLSADCAKMGFTPAEIEWFSAHPAELTNRDNYMSSGGSAMAAPQLR
jgi:hypothetical protein